MTASFYSDFATSLLVQVLSVSSSFGVTVCSCVKLPREIEGQELGQGASAADQDETEVDVMLSEPTASRVRRGAVVRIFPPW